MSRVTKLIRLDGKALTQFSVPLLSGVECPPVANKLFVMFTDRKLGNVRYPQHHPSTKSMILTTTTTRTKSEEKKKKS